VGFRYYPRRVDVHLSCRLDFSGVIQGFVRFVPAWE
jgi:hypothetical protein